MPKNTDISLKKLPPHDELAERSILCAILLNNDAIHRALDILTEKDFYTKRCRKIFETMKFMSWRVEPIDLVGLAENLLQAEHLEMVGGVQYLMDLMDVTPTSETITHHCRIVKNKSHLRKIISVAKYLEIEAYSERVESEKLIRRAEQDIFDVLQEVDNNKKNDLVKLGDSIDELREHIEAIVDEKPIEKSNFIPTGYRDVDNLILGVYQGDMVTLAARPSMGKTAFLFNMATRMARAGNPGVIFSLETDKRKCATRFLCSESQVDSNNIDKQIISREDMSRIYTGYTNLQDLPLYIYDNPRLTLQDFRYQVKRFVKELGIKWIGLDYIGLMKGDGKRGRSRQEEVSEISGGIKMIMREFGIAGIILCQLSREVEKRKPPRPILSDLRESGSIEQDSDMVWMLYRHSYYTKMVLDHGGEDLSTEFIVNKNRNGPVGTVKLVFRKTFTRFEDIEKEF